MKKLILIFVFFISVITLQAQVLIGVGTVANDGTGDPLRTAFQKHNTNVTAIYDSLSHIYTETQVTNFLNLHLDIDDTASMLGKYARKLSPTFTGTVTLPTATSIGSVSATEISYVNNVTSAIQTQIDTKLAKADSSSTAGKKYATGLMLTTGLNLKVNISDTASMLTPYINRADTAAMLDPYIKEGDTLSIADIATLKTDTAFTITFGLGTGATADTAVFNADAKCGSWKNNLTDTVVVVRLWGIIDSALVDASVGVQVSWADTLNATTTLTKLNTSAFTIDNEAVGNTDTSFANYKIPPGAIVKGTIPTVTLGAKPKYLQFQIDCYRIANHSH